MKLMRTIVFILLFAIVVAIYLFQVRLAKQSLTIIPDEMRRTVAISKNDPINRVELRDHGQKTQIVLQKKDGVWALERPVHYPAEGQIAEGFVIAARMASQKKRLRAEKEWSEYGLEKPEFEVLYELPGNRVVTLLIGAPAPVGKAIFARWAEERGFFLLPPEMKAMFRQSVYSLRQKGLFRAPVDQIRKIYVEMGEHSYQWKKDGGVWYWLEPVEKFGQKVPPGSMELVLEGLRNLHAREFLDNNKKSKAELGFFMIHDSIWVELEDGPPENQDEARPSSQGGKRETFYFGNEVPERNAYYGFREGEGVVFLVDRLNVIAFLDVMKVMNADGGGRMEEGEKQKTKDLTPSTSHPPPS